MGLTMTDEELAAIKRLLAEAAPGPWNWEQDRLYDNFYIYTLPNWDDVLDKEVNARLIAAAPTLIEKLVAEVERLQAKVAEEIKARRDLLDMLSTIITEQREKLEELGYDNQAWLADVRNQAFNVREGAGLEWLREELKRVGLEAEKGKSDGR